jgi:tetratricopeptide (TPR) repeat protein
MVDKNSLYFSSEEDGEEISYPDFFYQWDEDFENGISPKYYESEELNEIIEIYLTENEYTKAKMAIDHALKVYPDNEDMIYDILLVLNDFEKWNDLLVLSEKYENLPEVWPNGHRLAAFLHLGMEEDAFHFFCKMKTKYADDKEDLLIIYQAMGEALHEMDLYEASIEIINEVFEQLQLSEENEYIDLYWLQLHNYLLLDEKEKVFEYGEIISRLNPFDSNTWHRLGIAYKDANDLERAIDAFEFAKNLGYTEKENLIHLIQTYEQNGNYSKALENATEYLHFYPNSYLINIVASNICSQMEMWKEAIRFLDNAIKIEPLMDSLYLYKSNYFLNLGEQKKAKQALREGIKNTQDPEKDLGKELKRLNDLYPNI